MTLILIDSKLQEAIQKLNDAHLWTVDCCEGHFTDAIPNTYISFVNSVRFSDAPKDFILEKNGTVIRYIYRNRKSREGFRKEQIEVLKNLNSWIEQKTKSR